VNDYAGVEIPNYQALGLEAHRLYKVYRDPVALRAAVPLFDGLPLIVEHSVVTAANFDRVPVGSIHDCRFESGRVLGSVSVWPQSVIDDIETKVRSDLSAGYAYRPVLGAGRTPDGEAFDLRMADIRPQHVALVVEGRVEQAQVADTALHRCAWRVVTLDEALRLARAPREQSAFERAVPGYDRLR
jgi:hypothetical protein